MTEHSHHKMHFFMYRKLFFSSHDCQQTFQYCDVTVNFQPCLLKTFPWLLYTQTLSFNEVSPIQERLICLIWKDLSPPLIVSHFSSTQSLHVFLSSPQTWLASHIFSLTLCLSFWCLTVALACSGNGSYLLNQTMWTVCDFPEDAVMWHVVLFSILLSMGLLQIVLCGIQVVNGCLGCICGDCREKKDVRGSNASWKETSLIWERELF